MSELPRFGGKKAKIVERLRRGECPDEISAALNTSPGYVRNVQSELRRKHGITFTGVQHRPRKAIQGAAFAVTNRSRSVTLEPQRNDEASDMGNIEASTDPEMRLLRSEVHDLETLVAAREEKLKLSQRKANLKLEEILLLGEGVLQSSVSDVCPDIQLVLESKEAYVEVMVSLYHNPIYRSIFEENTPFWIYDRSDHRLRLVLEQIFDCTNAKSRPEKLASKKILTDSIIEFFNYHESHPLCPYDSMPGLPLIRGIWECPEHHGWIPKDWKLNHDGSYVKIAS